MRSKSLGLRHQHDSGASDLPVRGDHLLRSRSFVATAGPFEVDDRQVTSYGPHVTHHLVGAAEVAAILGISRQRVAQLATAATDFPPAEVELAAGRIWAREAIERWAADHADRGVRNPAPKVRAAGEWSPAVRTVADLAARLAGELNHHWVGTDHVFLALLHPDCPGLARAVLESFGLSLDDARTALVASMVDPFEPHTGGRTVPPGTQLLLEAAKLKAVELHDEEVTSEHVLLALTEKWDRCPLTAMVARRGVDAVEVRQRTIALSEAGTEASPAGWPVRELGPWPDLGPFLAGVELSRSPAGHDPRKRRSWGSVMFSDASGRTFRQGRAVRQYFVDRDGHPVLTSDGKPVHLLLDEQGEPVRDKHGKGVVGPVEVPPGCEVAAPR